VSEIFTHAAFQVVVVRKTASAECVLQETRNKEVEGLKNILE
jgi:hypothetical protein